MGIHSYERLACDMISLISSSIVLVVFACDMISLISSSIVVVVLSSSLSTF